MQIIGHRGARGEAPENTLSGFRYLKKLGIRAVEFDIHVAGDGQLVVIHDDSLERTTLTTGLIKDKTTAELAAVDACHRSFVDWPNDDGVPSLEDVLSVLADFEHLQLEVKAKTSQDCQLIAQQLAVLCQPFGSRAVTTSFNLDYLHLMQQTQPQIARGLLVEANFTGDIIALAQQLGCALIAPHHSLYSADLVAQAHALGMTTSTWTVNEPERMLALQAMGLDSLITDYPRRALALFA